MVESVDRAVLADKPPQRHGKPRRKAVARHSGRQHALLVGAGLVAEQPLARNTDHAHGDSFGRKLFGPLDQRRYLRTRCNQDGGRLGGIHHDITSLGGLHGLLAAARRAHRLEAADILSRENQRHGTLLLESQLPGHHRLVAVGRTQHDHRAFAAVVLQVLHQPDLHLLLDRLVRRTVLAHAERIVRPDVDHVQTHERRQTDGRLHVVREDEEGAARGDYASVQCHAVHHAGHRQLRDAGLEELPREVALHDGPGLLEEAVGFVRIRKVGRRNDHVAHLLGVDAQHGGRSGARRHVGLHLDRLVVDLGEFSREVVVELAGQVLVLRTPRLLDGGLTGGPLAQLLATLGEDLAALVEDGERIVGVSAQVLHRGGQVGSGGREGLSVR